MSGWSGWSAFSGFNGFKAAGNGNGNGKTAGDRLPFVVLIVTDT